MSSEVELMILLGGILSGVLIILVGCLLYAGWLGLLIGVGIILTVCLLLVVLGRIIDRGNWPED